MIYPGECSVYFEKNGYFVTFEWNVIFLLGPGDPKFKIPGLPSFTVWLIMQLYNLGVEFL